MKIEAWLPIFISFISLIISLLGFFLNRRTLLTEVISKQRIEWISNLRVAIAEFVSAYLNKGNDPVFMDKKAGVMLFLNSKNDEHKQLLDAIKDCSINDKDKVMNVDKIVLAGQFVINRSWKRMKREAGIDKHFETIRDKKM